MAGRARRRRFGAVALLLLTAGCRDTPAVGATAEPTAGAAVRIERVRPERVTPTLSMPGLVEASARIELAFRVTGFVARFHVDEGDRVAEGDLLAELDRADLEREREVAQAVLGRTRAQAREARRSFERHRHLRERDTASQETFDKALSSHEMAKAAVAEAETRLRTAEDRLAKATLRAPVTGHIEARLAEEHEVATAQKPVLVLSVLDPVVVRAAVADSSVSRLRVGGRAHVRSALHPEKALEGAITHLGVAADRVTRTLPFEVTLDNPELTLRPELVVDVQIPTGEPEPRLLVPLSAVLRDSDTRPFCFVAADADGTDRAERRPLRVGAVVGERVGVDAGLESGDRLIVEGQHFLRPGDPVRVVED